MSLVIEKLFLLLLLFLSSRRNQNEKAANKFLGCQEFNVQHTTMNLSLEEWVAVITSWFLNNKVSLSIWICYDSTRYDWIVENIFEFYECKLKNKDIFPLGSWILIIIIEVLLKSCCGQLVVKISHFLEKDFKSFSSQIVEIPACSSWTTSLFSCLKVESNNESYVHDMCLQITLILSFIRVKYITVNTCRRKGIQHWILFCFASVYCFNNIHTRGIQLGSRASSFLFWLFFLILSFL